MPKPAWVCNTTFRKGPTGSILLSISLPFIIYYSKYSYATGSMILAPLKKRILRMLGIADLRQRISGLERQVQYLAAFSSLSANEHIHPNAALLQELRSALEKEFAITDFKAVIHRNDMMLSHQLLQHAPDTYRALWGYYKVGARAARHLEAICREHNLPSHSLLDFGSGYGRMSRFLPAVFPGAQITISEVKEQAVQFQQEVLGFNGIHHSTHAREFSAHHFDLILALSVFTHLPEGHFKSWLATLTEQLRPGGALLFTINNVAQGGSKIGKAQDFCYLNHSEDTALPQIGDALLNSADYGSTFVSHAFVESTLRQINPNLKIKFLKYNWVPNQEAVLVQR